MLTWLLAGCASNALEVRVAQLEERAAQQDLAIEDLKQRIVAQREEEADGVVGKDALFVAKEWLQGEDDLDSHRASLLVFWEVWCPHCKREVPALQKTADTFGPQGLGVVGFTQLTRGPKRPQLDKFLDDNGVAYPIALDDGTMSKHYGVSGVPAA